MRILLEWWLLPSKEYNAQVVFITFYDYRFYNSIMLYSVVKRRARGAGFEPTDPEDSGFRDRCHLCDTDVQDRCLTTRLTPRMKRRKGDLNPPNHEDPSLASWCHTTWLFLQMKPAPGVEPRPRGYKPPAQATMLYRHLKPSAGVEPTSIPYHGIASPFGYESI